MTNEQLDLIPDDHTAALPSAHLRGRRSSATEPSPGWRLLIRSCETNQRYGAVFTGKVNRHHRYYELPRNKERSKGTPPRLPAMAVETFVTDQIATALSDQLALASQLLQLGVSPADFGPVIENAKAFSNNLRQQGWQAHRGVLQRLIRKVVVDQNQMEIVLDPRAVSCLGDKDSIGDDDSVPSWDAAHWTLSVPFDLLKAKRHGRTIIAAAGCDRSQVPDPALTNALLRARRWFDTLLFGQASSITELALQEQTNRAWISQQLPLAFLAPDIAATVIKGRHSPTLTLRQLASIASRNLDWQGQRTALKAISRQG